MTEIHHQPTPGAQPTYTAGFASTSSAAAAAAPLRKPTQISASSVDPITAEALTQSSTNPASALETPPPASAESTASASSALTSISVDDNKMSIEALIDLMNKLMLQSAQRNRDAARMLRDGQYQAAEQLMFASADADRDAAAAKMKEAWAGLATGMVGAATSGMAASKADGTGPKGKWMAADGLGKASGGIIGAQFQKEELDANAESKELSALATSAQRIAESTGGEGVSTADAQVRAAQDAISKNEQARHDSVEQTNKL